MYICDCAGYYISPVESPTWLLKAYAFTRIDPQVKAVMHRVGPELRFDNSKVGLNEQNRVLERKRER